MFALERAGYFPKVFIDCWDSCSNVRFWNERDRRFRECSEGEDHTMLGSQGKNGLHITGSDKEKLMLWCQCHFKKRFWIQRDECLSFPEKTERLL
jgi:hypothetical protein